MLWFLFALLTAFFESLKDVFSKKNLKDVDEYLVSWSLGFFTLLFMSPLLFFTDIPSLGGQFWKAWIIVGTLDVVSILAYMKAIKYSDLSITIPMIVFTPLFLLLTSPLIVGEFPSWIGLIGVLLIVLGSYTLNIKQWGEGYLAPFKALLKERGPKLMLFVAFIWSISSNFDKIGVQNSSPIFWVIAINIFIILAMLPIMLYKSTRGIRSLRTNYRALFPIGLFWALALTFQMTAINLTLVAYVISIKRTSAMMGVLFGHLIFKEKGIKERMVGAAIMIAGALFILLS